MTDTDHFNPQQPLSGARLLLQPIAPTDFDALFDVASDPLIWEQHPQRDRFKRHIFKDFFDGALASKAAFLVIDKARDKIIGSSRYHNPNFDKATIEIGWTFLARSHWGGSFNAELKNIMLNFAFRYFKEVHFYIGESNYRSQGAIIKLGAKRLNMIDQTRPGNYFYSLTKENYVGLETMVD